MYGSEGTQTCRGPVCLSSLMNFVPKILSFWWAFLAAQGVMQKAPKRPFSPQYGDPSGPCSPATHAGHPLWRSEMDPSPRNRPMAATSWQDAVQRATLPKAATGRRIPSSSSSCTRPSRRALSCLQNCHCCVVVRGRAAPAMPCRPRKSFFGGAGEPRRIFKPHRQSFPSLPFGCVKVR